jgi:hypothetical protein
MASGMVLYPVTSTVLVQGDGWADARYNSTQALQAFRQTVTPNGPINGTLVSSSTVLGNLIGFQVPNGQALWPYNQVVLVESPDFPRQPDRTALLFLFRSAQGQNVTQVNDGWIPDPPGRGAQPRGDFLFFGPPLSYSPPTTVGPLSGVIASGSLISGALIPSPPLVGFIPAPGPGLASPLNMNQFVSPPGDTSNSSALVAFIYGQTLQSQSVAYGQLVGAGALFGLTPITTTTYGNLQFVPAGSIPGFLASSSTVYGSIVGVGALAGLSISNSLFEMQGIGGSFIPLVPMRAVTDVRLNIGYQPWRVHPDDVIG